jgi:hypothetical protein
MADVQADGNLKLYYVPTIADEEAPTVAEIGAGTRLPKILKSGVSFNTNEGVVNMGDLDSFFNGQRPGTLSLTIDLSFKRDDTDESDTFDLTLREVDGYLVYSPFGLAIATKKVSVFPGTWGERKLVTPAENDPLKYDVTWYATEMYTMDAVVAA